MKRKATRNGKLYPSFYTHSSYLKTPEFKIVLYHYAKTSYSPIIYISKNSIRILPNIKIYIRLSYFLIYNILPNTIILIHILIRIFKKIKKLQNAIVSLVTGILALQRRILLSRKLTSRTFALALFDTIPNI